MLASRENSPEERERCGLQFRVYVPEKPSSLPRILLVHGRAGSDRVMWVFSKAFERQKPFVLAPQAPLADPLGGFSWWLLDPAVQSAEPSRAQTSAAQLDPACEALAQFMESSSGLFDSHLLSRRAGTIGIGFSQGGAVLAALSLYRPELFSGIAMLSSFVPSIALEAARPSVQTEYFIAHGTKDTTVDFRYAERSRDQLRAFGANVAFHQDDVGHKVSSAGLKALGAWMQQFERVD